MARFCAEDTNDLSLDLLRVGGADILGRSYELVTVQNITTGRINSGDGKSNLHWAPAASQAPPLTLITPLGGGPCSSSHAWGVEA